MPQAHREGPYRFHFYSFDCAEPPHVHVQRDREEAKVWLWPVEVEWNHGFSGHELRKVVKVIKRNRKKMMEVWDEHCGNL